MFTSHGMTALGLRWSRRVLVVTAQLSRLFIFGLA